MMIIRQKRMAPLSFQIFVNGKPVPQVLTHKHLGLIIEHTLSWTPQVISVCSRAAKKIGLLRRFRNRPSNVSTQLLHTTSIRPILEYAPTAWCSLSQKDNEQLERIQRRVARLIVKEIPRSDTHMTFSYVRSWLYASVQGHNETDRVLSLISCLSFKISMKNTLQR